MTDNGYTPVMPIILCKSNGGPFDDAAFIAGATCGAIIEELRSLRLTGGTPNKRYINTQYLPQIDLIAMAYGYTIKHGDHDEASGWQAITFQDYKG